MEDVAALQGDGRSQSARAVSRAFHAPTDKVITVRVRVLSTRKGLAQAGSRAGGSVKSMSGGRANRVALLVCSRSCWRYWFRQSSQAAVAFFLA